MARQVFVVHGGKAFNSYEEYIEYLKAMEVSLEDLKYKDWKHSLSEKLGSGYEVFAPRMPSGNNAKYLEWKLYFEKFIPYLRDGVLLVGHSLGGIFLAKYLSEEAFPREVSGVFLVAAPFNTSDQHPLADFVLHAVNIDAPVFLYHSRDDVVVPFSNFERYSAALPQAVQRIFYDRNHINQEEFPEILQDIESLQ